ncbi:MAG: hypothetical protein IJZ57_08335 [Clostridia bacterium]|nr:hypothetical protein [Clostridia bacterium]
MKNFFKRLLFPPLWMIAVLVIFSAVTVPLALIKWGSESPFSYLAYVVAFYTVCAVTAFFCVVFPKKYKEIKKKIHSTAIGNRYMTDAAFRTHISLYLSLSFNLIYAGVNILSFVLYKSVWFVFLAVYYFILAVMRFLLAHFTSKNKIGENLQGEFKIARACSYILLTVNFILSAAVLMILYQNKGFEYNGILIYVMAMYTFYVTVMSIINIVKYRKYKSPVMTTAKIITFSAALVSMLALETAMLSQFGADMPQQSQRLMIIFTGAGVSAAVIFMSVYMIVRTAKEIKQLRSIKNGK